MVSAVNQIGAYHEEPFAGCFAIGKPLPNPYFALSPGEFVRYFMFNCFSGTTDRFFPARPADRALSFRFHTSRAVRPAPCAQEFPARSTFAGHAEWIKGRIFAVELVLIASSHNRASSSGVCCEANAPCERYTMQQATKIEQTHFNRILVSPPACSPARGFAQPAPDELRACITSGTSGTRRSSARSG